MLGDLKLNAYKNVVVGPELFDDAGVVKLSDELAIVTTVDYFTPVVDDPFDFGAISAANSLSDLYAMGGWPISALNIVGFPDKTLPLSVLREIIKGGMEKATEAGIPIVGGHTVKSPEPFYGLSVTGGVHPQKILTNAIARVGDILYLTKPIGTGLITTALKNGKGKPAWLAAAVSGMKTLNKAASEAVQQVEMCAVTDVTGYGLLGHLCQMMAASRVSAEIDYNSVPLLPGALELGKEDQFPGGSRSNLLSCEPDMEWSGNFEKYEKLILADAQTSGGLLISVKRSEAAKLGNELEKRNVRFNKIGEIQDKAKWLVKVIKK
ncbi:MAG TPA: selenide, water dikinase SelD [candidate division Zixibacteria bacterium]|nr:selenide, water dikinase SelD [candidate division Zixibacteria bacterium]